MRPTHRVSLFAAVAVTALGSLASAAAITPGNVVVYRSGDGAAALSTAAAAIFLDEYTPAGTLVQSIAVPATGATQITGVGTGVTEGILSTSLDGTKIVFGGYRADVGTAAPTAAAVSRGLGVLNADGTVDTSATIANLGSANFRSATTVNGTSYYTGTSSSVRYYATTGDAGVSIDARNSRQVLLASFNGNAANLFASNGSTAVTAKVQDYGNQPTVANASPAAVVTTTTTDAINEFFFADLSPTVAGVDTLYAISAGSSLLRKFSFDGTSWVANGTIASGTGLNITGSVSAGSVQLFVTTNTSSGNLLQSLTDASGYNGTITGSLTTIATAGTNTAFRGIAILPVPEPTSLAALAGVALLGVARRRKA